jgi:NAD(P)-dependent dehydrogenase (short-subunit alcohol dehydrogenase family)
MDAFKDKVAIVTGGASGIGRALCEQLGKRGAVVTVADLNKEGVAEVASGINRTDGRAKAVHLDVAEAEQIQKLIDETVSEHRRLDYMFNNAGISIGGEVRDMNLEHWQRVIAVNLWGVIYGTTCAYSLMVRQGFGHIVNTASLAGLIPGPTNTPYGTSKYAVLGLSTSLRAEGAALGVKVTVVCPGFVQTGIYDASPLLKADKEKLQANIPFRMMDATKAAEKILQGVRRNRAIIVFPFHARFLWWLYRLCPSLLSPAGRKGMKDFRALRYETQAPVEEQAPKTERGGSSGSN